MIPKFAVAHAKPSPREQFLVLAFLSFVLSLPVVARAGGSEEVFHGMIADSQCALNVHSLTQSHKEMLQGKTIGTTENDCVWYCVKQRGGRFVLQNKEKVYKLDVQDIGKEYAGRKVKIVGIYESKINTIHVRSIELAEDSN